MFNSLDRSATVFQWNVERSLFVQIVSSNGFIPSLTVKDIISSQFMNSISTVFYGFGLEGRAYYFRA